MPTATPAPERQVRWAAATLAWAVFLLALALAYPVVGIVAWATAFLPVVAVGYGWGRRVGVLGAIVATVAGNVLFAILHGWPPGPWSEAAFATTLEVVVGYGAGWAGETRRRLDHVTAALHEQTVRLEEAQETAHIGSWSSEAGVAGAVTWSAELRRLFGLDHTPAGLEEIMTLIPAEDRPALQAFSERVLAGGEDKTDHRVVLPDGTVRWLHVRGRAETGPDGSVVRVGGTSQDVTDLRAAERALEQSLAQLEEAQAIGHIGSWHWEPGGEGSASAETRSIFGMDPSDLGNLESFLDVVHPDDQDRIREATTRALATGGEFDMSYRVVRSDGVRWVRSRGHVVPSNSGPGLTGTVQDVTDEEEARQTLASKESQLTTAQALAHVGSWEYDLQTREEVWSEETYRIFGVPVGGVEPSYEVFLERVHPDDLDRVRRNVRSALEGRPEDFECRVVRPDGDLRHVFVRMEVIRDGGRPVGLVGAVQDITERLVAAQALAAKESLLRGILDSQEGGFFSLEPAREDGERLRILVASRAMEEIFGGLPDPAGFLDHVHPDDRERVEREAREAFRGGARATSEFRLRRPDGAERWLRVFLTPVPRPGGGLERIDGHVLDVTAEKERDQERRRVARHRAEAQKLRDLDAVKATFLNTAAHELATPLTPLRLQLAMMRDQDPENEGIAMMGRNVERLQVLVQDLLDASRLQAGQLRTDLQPLRLDHILEDSVRNGEMQARTRGIQWTADVEPDLGVRGDDARLMQVVNNLLNNAFKFTPEGGCVSLSARRADGHAVVEVRDSGFGLTRQQMRGLFKPFNQFHRGRVGVHAGTGLGLYISRGIAERHGGTLTAASDGPDRGATFTLRLALAEATPPRPGSRSGRGRTPPAGSSQPAGRPRPPAPTRRSGPGRGA